MRGWAWGLVAFAIGTVSGNALAEDLTSENAAPAPITWNTSTHVGFAVTDRSTTGFKAVSGSMAFLDVSRPVIDGLEVGLRTIGQGGRLPERQFYRLGAGPMLTWKPSDVWALQLALTNFNETGLDADGQRIYQSQGRAVFMGWERAYPITRRVEAAWGGFASYYQGSVSPSAHGPGTAAAAIESPRINVGLTHGLEAAIRLSL